MKRLIFLIFILLIPLSLWAASQPNIKFEWDKEPLKLKTGAERVIRVKFDLPDGFFLYVNKTDLEFTTLEGFEVLNIEYPNSSSMPNPLGGSPVEVYNDDGEIEVRLKVPKDHDEGVYQLIGKLHYQACSRKVCLKPSAKLINWTIGIGNVDKELEELGTESENIAFDKFVAFFKGKDVGTVLDIKLKWLYIMAFIGGLLSSLTPCILPLIPITLLIIGVHPKKRCKGNLLLSFALVLGMSVAYAVIGVVAALMGKSISFLFQSQFFLILVIIFLVAMSLSLLGIYTFQLPKGVRNVLSRLGGGGFRGAFFAGISMGLLATPCVGPVLGALIVFAATSKSTLIAFTLFMVYSLGLGIVILIVGASYGTMVSKVKKVNVKWVKKIIGILVLLPALYYLNAIVPFAHHIMPKSKAPIEWQEESRVIDRGQYNPLPTMLIFTAEWCLPCKVLQKYVLRDPEIVRLSKYFTNIKIDTTHSTEENKKLVKRFDVIGWPTIIFLSPNGHLYKDLTITGGHITKSELVDSMEYVLKDSKSIYER